MLLKCDFLHFLAVVLPSRFSVALGEKGLIGIGSWISAFRLIQEAEEVSQQAMGKANGCHSALKSLIISNGICGHVGAIGFFVHIYIYPSLFLK